MSYFRNNRVPEYAAYGGVPTDEAYGRANGGVPFAEAYGKKRNVNDENENRPTLREQLEANWQKIKGREEEERAAEQEEEEGDEENLAEDEETATDNQTATGADEDFVFGQPSDYSGNDNIDKINDFVKRYDEMHQSISPQLYEPIGTQYAENTYTTTATDADYAKQPNYSLYGDGFSQKFIDQMLNDERFQRAMNTRTRANEGGYVNNPNDMGGATNYGISSRWYPNEDIINMTPERASAILYRDYWLQPKMYLLPDEFSDIVFDDGVLQGQSRSVKHLQNALGIKADGIIGPDTINALNNSDYNIVKKGYIKNVYDRAENIAESNPSQKEFLRGWKNRVNTY